MQELEKLYYIDKGSELTDYYCPSGFRWLTNTQYIGSDGRVEERAIDLIRNCWKYYGSVAVGPAFTSYGFLMHEMLAIYVKKVITVRSGMGVSCDKCGEYYEDNGIIRVETYFRQKKELCKNCFHVYSYEEITVGNEVVLVSRYRQW